MIDDSMPPGLYTLTGTWKILLRKDGTGELFDEEMNFMATYPAGLVFEVVDLHIKAGFELTYDENIENEDDVMKIPFHTGEKIVWKETPLGLRGYIKRRDLVQLPFDGTYPIAQYDDQNEFSFVTVLPNGKHAKFNLAKNAYNFPMVTYCTNDGVKLFIKYR